MRREYDFRILSKYKYPNLVAEFMETGYSICTLSEHMGNGRCKEDDAVINAKIFGDEKITAQEASGLAQLFGCKLEYLFSTEIEMIVDVPAAYIRHLDSNRRQEREMKLFRISEEIRRTLKQKPYFCEFMEQALTWNEEQVQQAIKMLQELKTA